MSAISRRARKQTERRRKEFPLPGKIALPEKGAYDDPHGVDKLWLILHTIFSCLLTENVDHFTAVDISIAVALLGVLRYETACTNCQYTAQIGPFLPMSFP